MEEVAREVGREDEQRAIEVARAEGPLQRSFDKGDRRAEGGAGALARGAGLLACARGGPRVSRQSAGSDTSR